MRTHSLPTQVASVFRLLAMEKRCLACTAPFVPPIQPPTTRQDGSPLLPEGPKASRIVTALRTLLYPDAANDCLCPSCREALARRTRGFCPRCGEAAAWPLLPAALCGRCLQQRPLWVDFALHNFYTGQLADLLRAFKFYGQTHLALPFGLWLSEHPAVAGAQADLVVPVPLHYRRLQHRGYNQAQLIASVLVRALGKKYACSEKRTHNRTQPPALRLDLLTRIRHTRPQSGLSLADRQHNIAEAFAASKAAAGKHILLVDDICTTGSTLESAAGALLRQKAAAVTVAVVAKTPERRRFLAQPPLR